ncbi:lamin tail domain-containing protein [Calderihabitans maritimus]|uniref:Hydrolase n=1 Tax=Calderihabitans maritimus TaxID=1246530 RepID=A0A1Z5HT41_9FIRM|nr:lamin tail domain-containing protein [Calderihabitans maritimus]GAW92475.1 hydrolase [Calderihabitans maritimus]
MIRRIGKKLKEDSGFTLVEMMVVVVILGTLAAVAIPSFTGKADKAKLNAAKADLKTIGTAIELYYVNYNAYPETLNALVGDYISKMPYDPWNNTQYNYDKDNDKGYYYVWVKPPKGDALYYPDNPTYAAGTGGVEIADIDLKGEVVTIKNTGGAAVDISGWKLVSEKGNQTFTFPSGTVIPAGEILKIVSGPNAQAGPSTLVWTKRYIWNNKGDPGALYDAQGKLVSRYE